MTPAYTARKNFGDIEKNELTFVEASVFYKRETEALRGLTITLIALGAMVAIGARLSTCTQTTDETTKKNCQNLADSMVMGGVVSFFLLSVFLLYILCTSSNPKIKN